MLPVGLYYAALPIVQGVSACLITFAAGCMFSDLGWEMVLLLYAEWWCIRN